MRPAEKREGSSQVSTPLNIYCAAMRTNEIHPKSPQGLDLIPTSLEDKVGQMYT